MGSDPRARLRVRTHDQCYAARMRIDAIAIGDNPPEDINVIVEVPVGGQPIKYELDKDAGTLCRRPVPVHADVVPGQLRLRAAHACRRMAIRSTYWSCNTRELVAGLRDQCAARRRADHGGQRGSGRERFWRCRRTPVTKRYDHITRSFGPAGDHAATESSTFFEHYKDLEPGKWVKIGDWFGADRARELIVEAIARAK